MMYSVDVIMRLEHPGLRCYMTISVSPSQSVPLVHFIVVVLISLCIKTVHTVNVLPGIERGLNIPKFANIGTQTRGSLP